MISDKRIEKAVTEYEGLFLSSLSAPTTDEHIFSEKFEAEMRKISRRADRKASVNIWKRVAVIFLISGLLFGMLAISKVDVRASITNWINWQFAAGSGHMPSDTLPPETPDAFQLTLFIPGYCSLEETTLSSGKLFTYSYADGSYLTFQYLRVTDQNNIYIYDGSAIEKGVTVFGLPAKIYLATDSTTPNTLVWSSHNNTVLFIISAFCSEQMLIKIAESIRPVEE